MGFNLDDYEPVAARLARFLAAHPNGAIHTEIVYDDGTRVVIKATAWRDMTDPMPAAVDYAEELLTDRGVNSTSRIENCATSATGRAISLLGFASTTDWQKKPSREEMAKVQRREGTIPAGSDTGGRFCSPKQAAFIRRLAGDRGIDGETALNAAISDLLGRTAILLQLTPAEASRVIDAWNRPA